MAIRYTTNDAAMKALLQSSNGPVVKDLMRRGLRVESAAKRLCPVDTGRLRSSISTDLVRQGSSFVVRVGTNVKYARAVHDGRRAVTIRPRRPGGVLVFPGPGGRMVFTRVARQPARPGKPFLRDALPAARG